MGCVGLTLVVSAFTRRRRLRVFPEPVRDFRNFIIPAFGIRVKRSQALSNTSPLEEELACEGIEECEDAREEVRDEHEDAEEPLDEDREEQTEDWLVLRSGKEDREVYVSDEHPLSSSPLEDDSEEDGSCRSST